jgi:hypothetical protein
MSHQKHCPCGCLGSCSCLTGGSCSSEGSCSSQGGSSCCSGTYHSEDKHDFAHQLLELADAAWMEVLKEKIKENIRTSSDKNLDELAKIISETNKERWQRKMAKKKACESYKEKLASFFSKK